MSRKRGAKSQQDNARKRPRIHRTKAPENDINYISKEDYVQLDNMLYVRPYVFEFRTNYKPRWAKKTVFQVFCDEFRHAESGYWEREFLDHRVLCNGEPINTQEVWQDGYEVIHLVHRHESAVLAPTIHIAEDHEGYVVVSKPPSYPVHPCGTYRRNSLQFVLQAFYGFKNLRSIHRLDKETSGLVILAKDAHHAKMLSEEIRERKVTKTYLAEVNGIFPRGAQHCNDAIYWDKRQMKSFVREDGVAASTTFTRISVDMLKGTSFVECKPLTGRTHQIRVHLAHIGFPIVNDPLYGTGDSFEGEPIFSSDRDPNSISLHHNCFKGEDIVNNQRKTYMACEWSKRRLEIDGKHLTSLEEGDILSCSNCPQVTNIKNVGHKAMYIHLHALKYESENWSFEVPTPPWFSGQLMKHKEPERKGWTCVMS